MTKRLNKKLRIGIIIIIVIVFVWTLFGVLKIQNEILKKLYPKEYEEIIAKCAEQFNVEENLILAIIKAESNFKVNAESRKGAKGLMQIMKETAIEAAKKINIDLNDENFAEEILRPEINIPIGTKYISTLLDKYENTQVALAAYNAGIGTVDTWIEKGIIKADGSNIEKIPYKETNQYVRKISRAYNIYQEIY